jgi:uncharacterized membrane protein
LEVGKVLETSLRETYGLTGVLSGVVLILSSLMIASGASAASFSVESQSGWNEGFFDGSSADLAENSGDLGIGYRNSSGFPHDLTAYFRLDRESGDLKDYSGNKYAGKASGSTVDLTASGTFDTTGFKVEGSSSGILTNVTHSTTDEFSGGLTVNVWAKWDGTNGGTAARIASSDCSDYWCILDDNGYNDGDHDITAFVGGNDIEGTTEIDDGNWHMITLVYDPGGTSTLYVDGQQEAEDTGAPQNGFGSGTTRPVHLGCGSETTQTFDTCQGGAEFDGSIDDFMMMEGVVLKQSEIEQLYFNRSSGSYKASYSGEEVTEEGDQVWEKIGVNATSIPSGTQVNANFTALNSNGEVIDWQTRGITEGANNYSLSLQNSRKSRVLFNGTSSDASKTWEISEYQVYYQNALKTESVETYRDGKPRSFYQENSTANITIKGSFQNIPEIGVIDSEDNVLVNEKKLNENSNTYTYPYEVNGSKGWYDIGFQPIISEWLVSSSSDWSSGTFENATAETGKLAIEGGERSEADSQTSNGSSWEQVNSQNTYSNPAVFASSNTENEAEGAQLAKVRNVDGSGFEIKFCEHENSDGGCDTHADEQVGWAMVDLDDLDSLNGIEAGKTTLGTNSDSSGEAATVSFDESFGSDAVVVAEQQTYNEAGESIVQVPLTGTSSFSMYLCDHAEGGDNCQTHSSEEVAWLAVDPSAELPEYMEAGLTSGIGDSGYEQQSFSKFEDPPVVKATINTNSGGQEAKSGRVRSVTASSADVGYCEHDSGDTCDGHADEKIGWVAFAEGERGSYNTGSWRETFDSGKRVYWKNYSISASEPTNTDYNITFFSNKTGNWTKYNFNDLPTSEYLRVNISMEGNNTETPEISKFEINYYGPRDFSNIRENTFYRSGRWEGNFTDAEGEKYTFRRRVNVSEPDTSGRFFSPVELDLDFEFRPDRESVRVVSWNGSRMLEIPSQVYDVRQSGGEVENASLFFLSSLARDENRTYYVVSSKLEKPKNYSGVEYSDTGEYTVENAYLNASFNNTLGGLMSDARNKLGTSRSLSGLEPVDRYPQFDVSDGLETDTKVARIDSTADVNVDEGPLRTDISVDGGMDGSSAYPYSVDCSIYAGNKYLLCEKNLTSTLSEDWSSLYFNGLVFDDSRFTWAGYNDGSTSEISLQDGIDAQGLSGVNWITFFNNETGDAAASLLLNKSIPAGSEEYSIRDGSSNDYFQYQPIPGSASVQAGESFYTETARLFYSGVNGASKVEDVYSRLENPVETSKGVQKTDDTEKPTLVDSGNISSSDQSDAEIYSRWEDDSFLNYAEINVMGNGVNGSDTEIYYDERDIRDGTGFVNNSWVNETVNASELNAGEVTANITVFDVAGKSETQLIEFNLSDQTPPEYSTVINEPDTEQSLDPNQTVNVTANITEYSDISNVKLVYGDQNLSSKEMSFQSEEDFVHKYEANFTPETEAEYTYYISTNDTGGLESNSSETELEVFWDYTWDIEANFSEGSGSFNENTTIGNLSLENTGDFNQTFEFSTAEFNQRTWVNGTQLPAEFEIGNKSEALFTVNATTRSATSTEGVDNFNLTVSNASAEPELDYRDFDVITSAGGPFLYTEFTSYNQTVEQGDRNITLAAQTINRGNETASGTQISFELPAGWSFRGQESSDLFDLQVGETESFSTKIDVSDNASTGEKALSAISDSIGNETYNTSVTVTVEAPPENTTIIQDPGGGGGGGGGAASSEGLSGEQRERLFQTEETYSIVRGKDANFTLEAENPFEEGDLDNVRLEITGFLDQYLSVSPEEIDEIPVNDSKNFTINIKAPDYFSRGEYRLNMTITGINNQSRTLESGNDTVLVRDTTEMTENRIVNLIVHEISRKEAEESLNASLNLTKEMERRGLQNRESKDTVQRIRESIESGNYQQARQLSQQIEQSYTNAVNARGTIENVTSLIDQAEYRGLNTPRTSRTLELAEAALERGDYSLAVQRADEARSLYTIETQGKTNYINLVQRKWEQISLGLLIFAITGFVGLRKGKIKLMERRISQLENERESINESMEEMQKQCFQEETISLDEYKAGMQQYREQLSENISREINLESKKLYWQKMLRSEPALRKKRERLQEMIEKAQQDYFEKKRISKTMYETKTEKYRDESAHVEEEIAEAEIQKRTGLKGKLNQIRG